MDVADQPHLDGVTHRWVDLPGLRLHMAEAGAGDPVVLLHGWPQHWWEWRHVIGPLAAHHRVIAPDLRGAGWTSASDPGGSAGVTPAQLVDDVLAFLEVLGLESVDLVAHDYSVFTAYRLCFDHPERIRHLLVLGPHPYLRFHPRMLAAVPSLWFQPVLATPGLGPSLLRRGALPRHLLGGSPGGDVSSQADVDTFVERVRVHAAAGSALYRRVILPEARRLVGGVWRGQRLTVPTVALTGALEPGATEELLAVPARVADDLRAELVPDAGHFLADERPDVVVERALDLFAR
jgi:pimeloyl-ACP methyl ester carboxylesterase